MYIKPKKNAKNAENSQWFQFGLLVVFQALEADHNDVVASMNSIILSSGLPKT